MVSSAGNQDNLRVFLDFADFEPGWDSSIPIIDKRLPAQVPLSGSAEAVSVATEAVGSASTVIAVTTVATNVVLSGALAQVWGMINGM